MSTKLRVCLYSSHLDGHLPELLASIRGKIDHICHIENEGWDWSQRMTWMFKISHARPSEILIFLDPYDTLFIGNVEELTGFLEKQPLLISATKRCWPHPGKQPFYEEKNPGMASPWRYVNPGVIAGKGGDISAAIAYGMRNFPITRSVPGTPMHNQDNDQRFWTDLYLSGYGLLDYQCELSQNLAWCTKDDFGFKDGRLHNLVTGSRPHFIHAAANTWYHIPKELLPWA